MRPEEKVGVAFAMSMGIFAAICAFMKAASLLELKSADFLCMNHFPAPSASDTSN